MNGFFRYGALVVMTSMGLACSNEEQVGPTELDPSTDEVRESIPGPLVKSTDAEVWTADNQWADTTTDAARKAGVAWGENSGLSWEDKYRAWIGSFEKIQGIQSDTIRVPTPSGRKADGPVLECADVAIWLRMTFASWYHLPYYMVGSRNGQTLYFGHFGIVDRNGNPVSGFPLFKTTYRDYEGTWQTGQAWPTDARLRRTHVGDDDDTEGVKVGDTTLRHGDGAGAYLDEFFLNKRAGYLMTLLDGYFGSMHLADGANMFHIKPETTSPGDALIERWQKSGIGHTLPVMTSVHLQSGKMRITVASGSMPRRQPDWEGEQLSANYFKSDETGGRGNSFDGSPYAKLGGGIRRWRTPVIEGGRWSNLVPLTSRDTYIEDTNLDAIAARPDQFKTLLAEDSAEAARDAAIAAVHAARVALRSHPASCTQRTRREDAFAQLRDIMTTSFGKTPAQVDTEYRALEDYVFPELEYNSAKTCCWDSTTPEMGDIILDFAEKERAKNDHDHVCRQPTPFKATDGGYQTWKTHAASLGRAQDWKDWSEDEPCAQRGVNEDSLTARGQLKMCR